MTVGKICWQFGFVCIIAAIFPAILDAQLTEREHYLGRVVEDFELTEPATGQNWSLGQQAKDAKAVVVYFLGTECPVNNLYAPIMVELEQAYREQGVVFVGINSNHHDTAEEIANHAREYSLSFPVLRDEQGRLARRWGVERTTEVLVLDAQWKMRFRGRVDDRYERGVFLPKTDEHYLKDALAGVLNHRPLGKTMTDVVGCPIAFSKTEAAVADIATPSPVITYSEHVASILQSRCQSCHREGDIGPFALESFDDADAWADAIREVVTEGLMPPWHANSPHGHFKNDRRLTDEEYETLLNWIDGERLEGDPAKLPPPVEYADRWSIGEPDLVLQMPEPFSVPAIAPEGGVPYQYFWVGEPFTETKYVQAAEVQPGNREVVHHIIVYVVPGDFTNNNVKQELELSLDGLAELGADDVVSFVPGDQAYVLPEGFATEIPKGSRLVFEMHYTPNGKTCTDQSTLAMRFAEQPPKHVVRGDVAYNYFFEIPPEEPNYPVHAIWKAREDVVITSFNPHMHYRGKSFRYVLERPDGSRETLLDIPRYDFNWQSTYHLAEPVLIPKGSVLECDATFDNSADNPFNPDPTVTVRWGEQTWEEMMLGFFDYYDPGERGEGFKSSDSRPASRADHNDG